MQDAFPGEAADLPVESLHPQELEPGVWRVPVPLPFATHATNVYLLRGGMAAQGWCLVDCPLGTAQATQTLHAALEHAGVPPTDLSAIVLTHAHPDHLGAVGYWQRLSGAPVYMLAPEARVIPALWEDFSNRAFLAAASELAAHGMAAAEAQALVTRAVQLRRLLLPPASTVLLAHGQRVRLAGATYHVHWMPGHADGHLCLLRDDGLLVGGDVVLPTFRPTVGRYPWSRPDPLGDQLASLDALAVLPVRLVLPGHGQPFTDVRRRVDELRGAYSRELVDVARRLADAPEGLSAFALASAHYAGRWHSVDARLIAMAEAVARLEHLCALGRASRVVAPNGAITYRRIDEGAHLSALERRDEPSA